MPYTGRPRRRRGHFSPGVTPGTSSLVGIYRPVPQILTRFQTKKCNFPHPFSDQTSKIHTRFQTWPLGRNYVIITQIRAQTKNYSNPFRIRIFLFLAYSFGVETINTFILSVVPSKTTPDSRPKWAKRIPPFSDQNGAKTLPYGIGNCRSFLFWLAPKG